MLLSIISEFDTRSTVSRDFLQIRTLSGKKSVYTEFVVVFAKNKLEMEMELY